jgi:hypothetical protein
MAYRLQGRVSGRMVRLTVEEGSATLGAGSDCDLRVDHPTVSRRHIELTTTDHGLHVRDLGSKNGTWIGAERVKDRVVIHGETMRLGKVELRVESTAADAPPLPEQGVSDLELLSTAPRPAVKGSAPGRSPFECFLAGPMHEAIDELAEHRDLPRLAAIVGHGLSVCLPLSTVEIGWTTPGADATLYCRRQDGVEFSAQQITRTRDNLYLYCAFKTVPDFDALEDLLDAALGLVALGDGEPPAPEPNTDS